MRAISALPQPQDPNPATDWRAIRESLRQDLDHALMSELNLANLYRHVYGPGQGRCQFCGQWSMGTRCADCLTREE